MEAIKEPPLTNAAEECVKDTRDEIVSNTETVEMDVCHTSNGVADSKDVKDKDFKNEQVTEAVVETTVAYKDISEPTTKLEEDHETVTESMETEVAELYSAETDNPLYSNEVVETEVTTDIHEGESTEVEIDNTFMETQVVEESIVVDGIIDNSSENITFETEIFIENNTDELDNETTVTCDEPDSSNILSELGQNIELSDALRSSDVSETVENNNCEPEVFNKEELLDILEGNDLEQNRKVISENFHADSKKLEEHLAMQQLNRLKGTDSRKRNRYSPKKSEKKQPKKGNTQYALKETEPKLDETISSQSIPKEAKGKNNETTSSLGTSIDTKDTVIETTSSKSAPKEVNEKNTETSPPHIAQKETKEKGDNKSNLQNAPKEPKVNEVCLQNVPKAAKAKVNVNLKPKKENIVKSLVQDWSDDDEPIEPEETNTLLNDSEALLESTEDLAQSQEPVVQEKNKQHESPENESSVTNRDTSVTDELTPNNKTNDETQPQRRLGRVIKKKVIFDPDNPDTFTKTKALIKKEKEALPEKDQPVQSTPKKIKTDQLQVPKTKSPLSKMQWKKPQPKNSNKQSSKRLTEIDRLLMDEGAVNMICQLTPEALKGNGNMKSRAEFIKNIQSNTPDTKEMKFRERKNKLKSEEGDIKKSGSAKHRLSLSTSVKSPAVSEDFENHSADDSIIYRRHSSSSYSSSCMSPRRLSDVEGGFSNQAVSQIATQEIQDETLVGKNVESNIFMEEKTSTPRKDVMNKSDCLSIKEKLNSKLSKALNKRKLSSFKMEKPSKVKKISHTEEISNDITVHFNQKVAEICIRKAGSLFSIQIMQVLENILSLVDSNNDISVTLITSESGTVCSGLDLKPILEDVKYAHKIAEQARMLMLTLEQHSKLVLIGVEGKIHGFGLALAALCDVILAGENATFTLAERCNVVMYPGAGVLTSRALPKDLLNELIVFGRELPASEALRGGLVSRVIWPERFHEQVRAIAKDIASQPTANVMVKKRLLGLKKIGSNSAFQACLENEREILVNYWTSPEGMALLRGNHDAA